MLCPSSDPRVYVSPRIVPSPSIMQLSPATAIKAGLLSCEYDPTFIREVKASGLLRGAISASFGMPCGSGARLRGTMILRWFRRRQEADRLAEADAEALIRDHGTEAYGQARQRERDVILPDGTTHAGRTPPAEGAGAT